MNSNFANRGMVVIVMLLGLAAPSLSQNWKILFDLRGEWKFEIGDDMHRAERGFDDQKWEAIYAPAAWEDEGYPGYDGYAWYRKHFFAPSDWSTKSLSLQLGNIDDVDEVYLNGRLVGSTGGFPPHYSTAYDVYRIYVLSPDDLDPSGDNVIAVRVYDNELSGGILRGKLGVYEDLEGLIADMGLGKNWKFSIGDDSTRRDPGYDDSRWKKIRVPAFWEPQGYPDYDGFAWYRIKFTVPNSLQDEKLILLAGKIDDFDETYLNGVLIGKTGNMATREKDIPGSDAYSRLRAYFVPPSALRFGGENVLAVRVYDGFKDGGIYSGPIGLITRDKYMKWERRQQKPGNIFDWFFR